MQIHVRFFAILRDRAGIAEMALNMEEGGTISNAATDIAQMHPAIAEFLPRIAYALNREYADVTAELHDGDELALIPPVSGG